jgi:hypothetical protein
MRGEAAILLLQVRVDCMLKLNKLHLAKRVSGPRLANSIASSSES